MVREIALDTETTGLDPRQGHRVIEIGCVEMVNRVRTGDAFHVYLNPDRDVPEGAFRIHGISTEFLRDKPRFPEVVEDFLKFLGDDRLVIHNAAFDMRFLNYELSRLKKSEIPILRATDTLQIARTKFPGTQANLDALCRRFGIDLSQRKKHGALLDAELLADVYLELTGGRQTYMSLDPASTAGVSPSGRADPLRGQKQVVQHSARAHTVTEEEAAAHKAFLASLKNPLWEQA
ncbi:MAG: dnaQ [Rickettsiales bacterium]|jgi:DNA polymerase-3 subunit epsilon|nr:dnaQ [Rickettsiales bacterium]